MTTYNGEKYVTEQLRSIMNQTRPVDELILCDDGSSDHTADLVQKLIAEKNTSLKIEWIQNPENLGYTRNFTKAIGCCHGDYIFLCDQDDIWEPNKVERMVETMEQNHIQFLCSNYSLIGQSGSPLTRPVAVPAFIQKAKPGLTKVPFFTLLFENIAQGCTYCFTRKVREVFLRADYPDLIHDYQLILIAASMDSAYFLNEKLIRYRIHDSNSVGLPDQKVIKKVHFHFHYYIPKNASFLKVLRKHWKVPFYPLTMAVLYLKIPVIYLVIRSHIAAHRK